MQPNACFAAIGGVRACSFSTSDYFSLTNWCGRQNRRRPQDRCLRSCTPQWGEAAAALVGALPTGPALLCCAVQCSAILQSLAFHPTHVTMSLPRPPMFYPCFFSCQYSTNFLVFCTIFSFTRYSFMTSFVFTKQI